MLQRPTASDRAIHSSMCLIQDSVVWSARRQKCMPMRRVVIQMLLKILTQFRDSGGASPHPPRCTLSAASETSGSRSDPASIINNLR